MRPARRGLRRARQSLLNAIKRYEKEMHVVVTDISLERVEIVASNRFGMETQIVDLKMEMEYHDRYLERKERDRWDKMARCMEERHGR